ncbi:MAG: D-alanine--D-alanine ligase [Candidatus Omnitrophota bacterium]
MANVEFGKIGVLCGGDSNERQISLSSGKAVYAALKEKGLDVIFIDLPNKSQTKDIVLSSGLSLAFIALHGGFGEDGTIQAMLDEIAVPYTGSGAQASSLAFDKWASKQIFKRNGFPTPCSRVVLKDDVVGVESLDFLCREFGFPFVVKPVKEGSSIGMSLVRTESDLKKSIDEAFSYDKQVLIEKYIKGEDITVGVLGNMVLPIVHIKPRSEFYDYNAKYNDSLTKYVVPADISKEITSQAQELGLRVHNAIGCRGFSRVDMILDEHNNIFVLELNSIPGLTSSSLLPKAADAAGISFGELCVRMCELAMSPVKV